MTIKIITLIGSIGSSRVLMIKMAEFLIERGYKVYTPRFLCEDEDPDVSLLETQRCELDNIKEADLVIAFTKGCSVEERLDNNGTRVISTFGESTSYELAIASALKKPILFFNSSPFFTEFLENEVKKGEN